MSDLKSDHQEAIFTFSKGIPGFPELTNYVVIQQIAPFSILQAVGQPEVSFILIDPFVYYPDYEIELVNENIDELEIKKQEHIVVRSIVSWSKKSENRTVNLVAPVVFNLDNHMAKQIILQNTAYTTRHPLVPKTVNGGEV